MHAITPAPTLFSPQIIRLCECALVGMIVLLEFSVHIHTPSSKIITPSLSHHIKPQNQPPKNRTASTCGGW